MLRELNKEYEEIIREDAKKIHQNEHIEHKRVEDYYCRRCALRTLLKEIDQLRVENMQLRVNP